PFPPPSLSPGPWRSHGPGAQRAHRVGCRGFVFGLRSGAWNFGRIGAVNNMLEQLKGRKLLRLSGDDVEVALRFDGCTVTTRAAMTVLESREGGEPANPPDG